jgi:hypothetical protein
MLISTYENGLRSRINVRIEINYLLQLQLWFKQARKAHMFLTSNLQMTPYAVK